MATMLVSRMETLDESSVRICSFCDIEVDADSYVCPECDEYKGLVTIEEWESVSGEIWES